jgi:hypothetical protein
MNGALASPSREVGSLQSSGCSRRSDETGLPAVSERKFLR